MILGKRSAFENLRRAVSTIPDVDATWLPIELEPAEWIARLPIVWGNHSLRIGSAAWAKVQKLRQSKKTFDGIFFNHILATPFLMRMRSQTPCVDSLDVTPIGLARYGQAYYQTPRPKGARPMRYFKTELARSIYMQASYLFPYSEFTKRSLVEDYRLPESKVIVLPPGTDLNRWPKRNVSSEKRTKLRVLFVGSEFQRKGGDILLNIARRDEFRDWEFHFVTRTDVGHHPSNVFVHKNFDVNSDGLRKQYEQADVFLLPTRADFAPTNSVSEAMAMGLPVISTNVGGLDEVVRDGQTGYVVPVNDEEAIVDRLRMLSADWRLRVQLGHTARTFAEDCLNVHKNARRIVDYLKQAVVEKHRRMSANVSS